MCSWLGSPRVLKLHFPGVWVIHSVGLVPSMWWCCHVRAFFFVFFPIMVSVVLLFRLSTVRVRPKWSHQCEPGPHPFLTALVGPPLQRVPLGSLPASQDCSCLPCPCQTHRCFWGVESSAPSPTLIISSLSPPSQAFSHRGVTSQRHILSLLFQTCLQPSFLIRVSAEHSHEQLSSSYIFIQTSPPCVLVFSISSMLPLENGLTDLTLFI